MLEKKFGSEVDLKPRKGKKVKNVETVIRNGDGWTGQSRLNTDIATG